MKLITLFVVIALFSLSSAIHAATKSQIQRKPANTLILSDTDIKLITENMVKDFFKTRDDSLVKENDDEAYRPVYEFGNVSTVKEGKNQVKTVAIVRKAATQICDMKAKFIDDWNFSLQVGRCSE